jgi:hypothetical protein
MFVDVGCNNLNLLIDFDFDFDFDFQLILNFIFNFEKIYFDDFIFRDKIIEVKTKL